LVSDGNCIENSPIVQCLPFSLSFHSASFALWGLPQTSRVAGRGRPRRFSIPKSRWPMKRSIRRPTTTAASGLARSQLSRRRLLAFRASRGRMAVPFGLHFRSFPSKIPISWTVRRVLAALSTR
jgi:hypothetical protein